MRFFWLSLLVMFPLFGAELSSFLLGDKELIVVNEQYDLYKSKGEVAKFYKEQSNRDLKFLKSFTLQEHSGGCAAQAYEKGVYEVNGTRLYFYTQWSRSGKAYDAPIGVRIEEYQLEGEQLKRCSSLFYIELEKRGKEAPEGMEFLFAKPKNSKEEHLLNEYINEVEKDYNGKFLLGDEAKALQERVDRAFKRALKQRWKALS